MASRTSIYAQIPAPKDDTASLLSSLKAVVQNVQSLCGVIATRGGNTQPAASTGAAAHVWCYRKTNSTAPDPVGFNDGDMWLQPPLQPGDVWIKLIWFQGQWITLP